MGILTEEMKRVVAQQQLCYAASVTPDGKSNHFPKVQRLRNDTFHLLGENSHHVLLAWAGCYSSTFRYDRLPAILSPARVRMSQAWNRSSSPSTRVPVTNNSTTTWSLP